MKILFTVPGKPVGYYACGKVKNWTRFLEYKAFMQKARTYAAAAGIKLPLRATKAAPVMIRTTAYFENGVHCDPENVRKGMSDALFYKGGGDKYCGGSFPPPLYDAKNPRVEVEVEFVEAALSKPGMVLMEI